MGLVILKELYRSKYSTVFVSKVT